MKLKWILFDMDGTLFDSLRPLVDAYNETAPFFGCETVKPGDEERLKHMEPRKILRELRVTPWKKPFLLMVARRKFRRRLQEVKPFDGVATLLETLFHEGYSLGIVTSNSKENVGRLLERFELTRYISFVHAERDYFGKGRVIELFLRKRNLSGSQVAYVGDEVRDVQAAQYAGVLSVAVGWGLNARNNITSVQPDFLAENLEELLVFLRSDRGERSEVAPFLP